MALETPTGTIYWDDSRIEPSSDLKIRLIADYDNIDEVCCTVVNIVDGPTGNAVRALGGIWKYRQKYPHFSKCAGLFA